MSNRGITISLLFGLVGAVGVTSAVGKPMCSPALAFKEVQLSKARPPTMERRWSAIVSIDASRCPAKSAGYFEIVFLRLKENGPDLEFREEFVWTALDWLPSLKVEVDLAADEAIDRYWFDTVTPCRCTE
jgi:hypothetical protein